MISVVYISKWYMISARVLTFALIGPEIVLH
jgi:hypothetical protein